MRLANLLVPPAHRAQDRPDTDQTGDELMDDGRREWAVGPNAHGVAGRSLNTLDFRQVTVNVAADVSDGNFGAYITPVDSNLIIDSLGFTPSPDGMTWIWGVNPPTFALDATTGIYYPVTDFASCSPPGTAFAPAALLSVPPRRYRMFVSIWSPAKVLAGAYKAKLIFANYGDGR